MKVRVLEKESEWLRGRKRIKLREIFVTKGK